MCVWGGGAGECMCACRSEVILIYDACVIKEYENHFFLVPWKCVCMYVHVWLGIASDCEECLDND